jgi:hypothetical protein
MGGVAFMEIQKMNMSMYEFEALSTKKGFNRSLGHFRTVSSIIDDFESHINLADILNDLLNEKEISHQQITPIVSALLIDKYEYSYASLTIPVTLTDFSPVSDEVKSWKAVDIVLLYFHPDLGPMVFNPKNEEHFNNINSISRSELLTIYAGSFEKKGDDKIASKALDLMSRLFSGKNIKTPDNFKRGSFAAKPRVKKEKEKPLKSAPSRSRKKTSTVTADKAAGTVKPMGQAPAKAVPAPAAAKRRMTPFYAVPVTNELFHNGNVEAWKKVIQSYNQKYPNLEVYIYYEGERIHDIHSLFKWGKVKHGSAIMFAVAGEDIKDVAKLQRYLKQGASPKFEEFLKFPISQILNLF